jgi:uncharacterized spore protein YtfJ
MSETNITDIVNNLLDGVHEISKSETIVGQPQQAGDATVIPVHRLKVVFGAGSGSAGAHGKQVGGDSGLHGAGGAVELDPVAAIAVDKDGVAHVMAVEADSGSTWSALMQEVPDLIAKFAHTLGDRVNYELQTRGMGKGLKTGEPSPDALPEKSGTDQQA